MEYCQASLPWIEFILVEQPPLVPRLCVRIDLSRIQDATPTSRIMLSVARPGLCIVGKRGGETHQVVDHGEERRRNPSGGNHGEDIYTALFPHSSQSRDFPSSPWKSLRMARISISAAFVAACALLASPTSAQAAPNALAQFNPANRTASSNGSMSNLSFCYPISSQLLATCILPISKAAAQKITGYAPLNVPASILPGFPIGMHPLLVSVRPSRHNAGSSHTKAENGSPPTKRISA